MFLLHRIKLIAVGLLVLSTTASAGTILYGGLEDYAGGAGIEKIGDFNDLTFAMNGDLTVIAPGAGLSPLTSSMINETGNIYWDQRSSDGPKYNLGYCVLGGGSCPTVGQANASYEYLAGAGGAGPTSILLDAQGPVTIDYLLRITAGTNSLGWYDPSNPSVLHPIFSASNGPGDSATFVPSGIFALYSVNVFGQFFSTVTAANIGESGTQQHFAFISDPPNPSQAPEPATLGMIGGGFALLFFLKRSTP